MCERHELLLQIGKTLFAGDSTHFSKFKQILEGENGLTHAAHMLLIKTDIMFEHGEIFDEEARIIYRELNIHPDSACTQRQNYFYPLCNFMAPALH